MCLRPKLGARGEAFAGAASERDDLLAFVEAERVSIGGRGFVDAPGGLKRLSEVVERVPLMPWRVCTDGDDHGFPRKALGIVMQPPRVELVTSARGPSRRPSMIVPAATASPVKSVRRLALPAGERRRLVSQAVGAWSAARRSRVRRASGMICLRS